MEQTEKPIRVRNAGDELRQWPVQPDGLDHRPCAESMRDARIVTVRAPRARFLAQSFRTPLRGKRNKEDRQALGPDETRGDDARLARSLDGIGGLQAAVLRTPMLCIGYGEIRGRVSETYRVSPGLRFAPSGLRRTSGCLKTEYVSCVDL